MNVPRTAGRRFLLPLCAALLFLLPQACDDRKKGGEVVMDDREPPPEGPAGRNPGERGPSDGPGSRSGGPRGSGGPKDGDHTGTRFDVWLGRGLQGGGASAGPPLFGPELAVTFTAKELGASSVAEAGLILLALPEDEFGPGGTPPEDSMGPLFQWVRASQKVQWPVSIKVRLPTNPALKVLAIVDVDGSGRLSAGDYLSKPLSVAEATRDGESTAVFPIVRVLSATSDTPSLEVEEGVAYGAVALTVDVAKELVGSKPSGRIIVSGSRSGPEGQASEKPSFYWASNQVHSKWPARLDVQMPAQLDVRVLLDQNGDHGPDPGDLTGAVLSMFSPPPSGQLEFKLDRPYSIADEVEADEGVTYGAVDLTVELASALLGSKPAGRIVVLGTPAGPEGQDSEKPPFYWASKEIYSEWPVSLEAQMPSGLDVRVLLDQNGGRGPDGGDLTGAVLPMFSPPKSGQLEFKLDRPYSVTEDTNFNEEPFPGSGGCGWFSD